MAVRKGKFSHLHPRTSTKAKTVSEYVDGEVKKMANKPRHVHTTPEYREWLVRQAQKRGK